MRKVLIFITECVAAAIVFALIDQIPWSKLADYIKQGAVFTADGVSTGRDSQHEISSVSGTTRDQASPDKPDTDSSPQISEGGLPTYVDGCSTTAIKSIGTRLEDVPDSGSAVAFENGGQQFGYDTVPEIEQSRKGAPVRMCLLSVEEDCPKGREPAREYRVTNLRTGASWTRSDQSHSCQGA